MLRIFSAMLSPEELLASKKKTFPGVYSLGKKGSNECNLNFDNTQLNMKLKNIEELLIVERVKMRGSMSKAVWRPEMNCAELTEKQGPYWDSLGRCVGGHFYLYPEEALYLVDIGSLELVYNGVPLSLQRAFFLLLNKTGVSFHQYRVFSHLTVLGYIVVRHCVKNVLTKYEKTLEIHKIGIKHKDVQEHSAQKSQSEDVDDFNTYSKTTMPISYGTEDIESSILSRLQIIKRQEDFPKEDYKIDFDVFLPKLKSQFRKSTVQLPDFRILVLSNDDSVPVFSSICGLKNCIKDDVPLIHAVVHPDFINYFQISSVDVPVVT